LSSKDSSRIRKDKETINQLIERAYWALTMNALEPVNYTETYSQVDVESLIDDLREYLNG
tara:strand:- start:279 stop:458 length:180 start_codon:yes stop_codon:yes gene_type:complete